jgi:hypothetical protein
VSRIRNITPIVAALVLLAAPVHASASPQDVVRDCASDGKLDHHYSDYDLRNAKVPTDVAEYTDCRAVIAAARNSGHGGGSASAVPYSANPALRTDAGSSAASPTDLAAFKAASGGAGDGSASPVTLGGRSIAPVTGGLASLAGAANRLPTPLLVALIAIAVLCAAGGIVASRRRWPQLWRAPLRLIRR